MFAENQGKTVTLNYRPNNYTLREESLAEDIWGEFTFETLDQNCKVKYR